MNHEMPQQNTNKGADTFKLLIAAAFVGGGVWAYDGVKGLPPYTNLVFPIGGVLIALLIVFFWCDMGRNLLRYIKESTAEVKKVVWPKRPDAVRMTMFVVLFVAVFAVFIYGVDTLISLLINAVLLKG